MPSELEIEAAARAIADLKCRVIDQTGAKLPADIWKQAIPDATIALSAAEAVRKEEDGEIAKIRSEICYSGADIDSATAPLRALLVEAKAAFAVLAGEECDCLVCEHRRNVIARIEEALK